MAMAMNFKQLWVLLPKIVPVTGLIWGFDKCSTRNLVM